MVHYIMNHLWRQCNSNINKSTKTNQHICRDTRDWLLGSAKPTFAGLSLDTKDFTIYQLGYKLVLYETRLPFSPTPFSLNSLTVKHRMNSPHPSTPSRLPQAQQHHSTRDKNLPNIKRVEPYLKTSMLIPKTLSSSLYTYLLCFILKT